MKNAYFSLDNCKNMERKIMQRLCEWRDSKNRKPLVVNGARQVGKTYILKYWSIDGKLRGSGIGLQRDTVVLLAQRQHSRG